jgi:hypothetical protein
VFSVAVSSLALVIPVAKSTSQSPQETRPSASVVRCRRLGARINAPRWRGTSRRKAHHPPTPARPRRRGRTPAASSPDRDRATWPSQPPWCRFEHPSRGGVPGVVQPDRRHARCRAMAAECLGVGLGSNRGAVLFDRDEPRVDPCRAECQPFALLLCVQRSQSAHDVGRHRQGAPGTFGLRCTAATVRSAAPVRRHPSLMSVPDQQECWP